MTKDLDPRRLPAQHLAGLMFADHAGDVVIYHHHLIHQPLPLHGKHPDGGRAAANAHPPLGPTIHDGRFARLNENRRATVDGQINRLTVAKRQHGGTGEPTFGLGSARQVMDPAQRQHLAAIFGGGDMANRLPPRADDRAFGAKVAIGVDLHLDTAIGKDRLGDDRHHIGPLDSGGHNEGRGLIVGVGGARADGGDEGVFRQWVTVPVARGKGHQPMPGLDRMTQHHHWIGADDAA